MWIEKLSEVEARNRLAWHFPELFGVRANSSLKQGLFTARSIGIEDQTVNQVGFFFQDCSLAGETFDIVNLRLIYHPHYKQIPIYLLNYLEDSAWVNAAQSVALLARNTPWWCAALSTCRPHDTPQADRNCHTLQIRWTGIDRQAPSQQLTVGYWDLDGFGPQCDVYALQDGAVTADIKGVMFYDPEYLGENIGIHLRDYPDSGSLDSYLTLPLSLGAHF